GVRLRGGAGGQSQRDPAGLRQRHPGRATGPAGRDHTRQPGAARGPGAVPVDQRRPPGGDRRLPAARPGAAGFQVGAYNPDYPLYIDPVLNYSSYLGGSGTDDGQAVAVDTAGNVYLTGSTLSADFPTSGSIQGTAGGLDAFITKLDRTGTKLEYSTYLGGSSDDEGRAIAVDVSGNVY